MKCLIETPSQELLQNVQTVAAQHKSCGVPSAHSFCLSKALSSVSSFSLLLPLPFAFLALLSLGVSGS